MPRLPLVLAGLLLALPAPPAAAQDWQPGELLAALSGDWDADGSTDLAVLVRGGDIGADLILYASRELRMEPVLTVRDVAFAGVNYGQIPTLAARSATSFVIGSEQTAVGRNPWERQVTVAFRNGAWVVAGFTHAHYDRLDPDRGGHCDVNLLSGGWERAARGQRQAGRDGPRAFPLARLDQTWLPDVCRAIFD